MKYFYIEAGLPIIVLSFCEAKFAPAYPGTVKGAYHIFINLNGNGNVAVGLYTHHDVKVFLDEVLVGLRQPVGVHRACAVFVGEQIDDSPRSILAASCRYALYGSTLTSRVMRRRPNSRDSSR